MSGVTHQIGIKLTASGGAAVGNEAKLAASKFDQLKDAASGVRSTASEAVASLKQLAAAVGVTVLVKEFIETADAAALMDSRLKLVTGSAGDFAQAKAQIYKIAQQNNLSLAAATELYTKMAEPVQRLGGSTKETAAITEAFAASMRLGGASAEAASGAAMQFAQAMGSGKLSGDEFNSMAEASPRFMKALAEGMGVPIGQLKEMAGEGQLTADVVGNALISSLSALRQEAAQMPDTVGGAMQRLQNDITSAVAELNQNSGLTLGLAGLLELVRTDLVPLVRDTLGAAFTAVGGAVEGVRGWLASSSDSIQDIWTSAKGLLGDVWELGSGALSSVFNVVSGIVGFVADWLVKSGALKAAIDAIRLIVAGLSDGIEIVAAGFMKAGAYMLDLAGLFSDSAKSAAEAAHAAADKVFEKFANGKTAVMALNEELARNASKAKQTQEALALSGESAADLSQEMRRLVNQSAAAAGGYTKLSAAAGTLTDEQKKAGKEAAKLAAELDKLALSIRAESAGLSGDFFEKWEKLNALRRANKISVQELEAAQKALLEKMPFMVEATKRATEAEAERFRMIGVLVSAELKEADSIAALVEKQREQNAVIGLTTQQLAALELAKIDDALATAQQRLQAALKAPTDAATLDALTLQVEGLRELKRLKTEGVIQAATVETAKQAADAWAKTNDDIGRGLTDSLFRAFESGKGFFKTLWDGIKNTFKTTVLKLVIGGADGRGGIAGSLLGALGLGGSGSALAGPGSAGGASGLLGGLGSVGSLFGAGGLGGSLMAGAGWMTGATSLTGALGAAGSLMGTGSMAGMMSGLGMAAGALGPIALGVALIHKLGKGDSGTQHQGSTAYADALGSTTTDGRAINFLTHSIDRNANIDAPIKNAAASVANILNAIGGLTGAKFGVDTGYADDTSRDGAFGALRIRKDGQSILDWESGRTTKWAPKTFSDGEAGFREYLAALAGSTKQALDSIGLPKWAAETVSALGGAPTLEQLASAADLIAANGQALAAVGDAFAPLGGVFSRISDLSDDAKIKLIGFAGGIDALISKTSQYVADFYTADEKNAITAASINAALEAAGITTDFGGKGDWRALVDGWTDMSDSGLKQLSVLLDMSSSFAGIADYLAEQGTTLDQLAESAPQNALVNSLTTSSQAQTDLATQQLDQLTLLTENADAQRQELTNIRAVLGEAVAAMMSVAVNTAATASTLRDLDTGEGLQVAGVPLP